MQNIDSCVLPSRIMCYCAAWPPLILCMALRCRRSMMALCAGVIASMLLYLVMMSCSQACSG